MIFGIGLDTIEIERIKEKLSKNDHFEKMIFSEKEIGYCNNKENPFQHYAVRFAAKEAFLKAAGVGLDYSFNLAGIEVVNDNSGKPFLYLSGEFEQLKQMNQWKSIHLSLSHTKTEATAIVIIDQ